MSIEQTLEAIGPLLPDGSSDGDAGRLSLRDYATRGRLVWLDYAMQEDGATPLFQGVTPSNPIVANNPDQKYLYPARALFAVTAGGKLKSIAIQCMDQKTRNVWDANLGTMAPTTDMNRLFTPPPPLKRDFGALTSDAEKIAVTEWAMAKTCVQVAEASHFELITHLGRTHLVLEAVAIATHRKLPKDHPIRKLLGAHLEGTMHVNELAAGTLIGKGEAIDQAFAPSIDDAAAVAVGAANAYLREFSSQRFDAKVARSALPEDLEAPMRDDGRLVWAATQQWAQTYVGSTYAQDGDVAADQYVQAWAAELTSQQGGRMSQLCQTANNNNAYSYSNSIATKDCLEQVLTQVVWIATAGHAATNFPQATFTAYTPLAPVAGYSRGPNFASTTGKVSGQAWLDMLPRAQGAVLQRDFGSQLGSVYYNWAGHYLGQYKGTWDGWLGAAHTNGQQQFRDALADAGRVMAALNNPCPDSAAASGICVQTRRNSLFAYTVLEPHNIPQSINI